MPFLLQFDLWKTFFVDLSTRRFPFLLEFDFWTAYFAEPPRAFFSTAPLFQTISTQFDLRETLSQPTRFLCRFILVSSLQSSADVLLWERIVFCFVVVSSSVCNLLILAWIIVHYFLFVCSISFCMYLFDNFSSSSVDKFASTRLKSISSALALPVSRGRHRKLLDNFSHESDVTSLQDPFTSRPYKTPFYFTIVFPIQSEEAFSNPCRIFAIFSTLSLCACILRHRVEDYVSLLLCQAVGAASRDIEILVVARPNSIICCFCGILQFPAIFSFNALPWFDAAPTTWY